MEMLAAGFGLFESAIGIFGAGNQKRLEEERVKLEYADNLEKIRRREFEQNQTLGLTRVLTEASGVRHTSGSTPQRYLDLMSQEFEKELTWMREYAGRAKKLGMRGADVRAQARILDAIGGGIKSAAGIYKAG